REREQRTQLINCEVVPIYPVEPRWHPPIPDQNECVLLRLGERARAVGREQMTGGMVVTHIGAPPRTKLHAVELIALQAFARSFTLGVGRDAELERPTRLTSEDDGNVTSWRRGPSIDDENVDIAKTTSPTPEQLANAVD